MIRVSTINKDRYLYFQLDSDGDVWIKYGPPSELFPPRTLGCIKGETFLSLIERLAEPITELKER